MKPVTDTDDADERFAIEMLQKWRAWLDGLDPDNTDKQCRFCWTIAARWEMPTRDIGSWDATRAGT